MVKQVLPDELTRCRVPVVPGASWQSDVADYLADLHYEATVCKRKMDAVREALK